MIKKELDNLIMSGNMGRRIGKTTAIVEAAKKIGATIVCANKAHARMLKEDFKIETVVPYKEIRGTKGPYLYDHFAMEFIAHEALREIEKLEKKVEKLKQDLLNEQRNK